MSSSDVRPLDDLEKGEAVRLRKMKKKGPQKKYQSKREIKGEDKEE